MSMLERAGIVMSRTDGPEINFVAVQDRNAPAHGVQPAARTEYAAQLAQNLSGHILLGRSGILVQRTRFGNFGFSGNNCPLL